MTTLSSVDLQRSCRVPAQRIQREKEATLERYRRRRRAIFNWWFPFLAANLLRRAWKAQWSLVFKTEAARQLTIAQQEMAMHIQRKWRDRVAFRCVCGGGGGGSKVA